MSRQKRRRAKRKISNDNFIEGIVPNKKKSKLEILGERLRSQQSLGNKIHKYHNDNIQQQHQRAEAKRDRILKQNLLNFYKDEAVAAKEYRKLKELKNK